MLFKQRHKIQDEAKTRKTTIRRRSTRLTTTTKTKMEPIHLAYTAKRQITHKGSVGGGLMSSARNMVRLDTWSGFASHDNMKRQKLMLIPRAPGVPRSCQMDGCATSTKIDS